MKVTVKRKVLREDDELTIPSTMEIKPIATFRIQQRRDGKPTIALEVWYLEIG
jgi:hypothetical protein